MSVTRMQEIQICFGKQKQADIATANTGVQMWQLRKLNAALANPKLNTENDAEEFGKGHEFPTQSFQTSWDVNGTLEKYLSAEIGAWAMAFGLGKVVKSGTTPNFTYTCTPLFPRKRRCGRAALFLFRRADPPGRGRRRGPDGRGLRGRRLDHLDRLGAGPRELEDHPRVRGLGQVRRAVGHHHARGNRGKTPAVGLARALD
ncbi:MAG: hypothetical protein KatS3mg082_1901 [Nitrospiraceae bacterium]|nr:MAG: hypothetical protein KatS3mg082_1901 [Nitrospiraceae bacterium]